MECNCCHLVRGSTSFFCTPCSKQDIATRRARLARAWKEREYYEQHLNRVLAQDAQVVNAAQQTNQRQKRIAQMRLELEKEQKLLQQDRETLAKLSLRNKQRKEWIKQAKQMFAHQVETQNVSVTQSALMPRLTDLRETFVLLANKRVEELLTMYVIRRRDSEHCSIVSLSLPDNLELWFQGTEDPEAISSALGYMVFLLQRIAEYLGMWLPFPLTFAASASSVRCVEKVSGEQQTLPLYGENDDDIRRAVALLDGDVKSLCLQNGMPLHSLGTRLSIMPELLSLIQAISLRLRTRTQSAPENLLPLLLEHSAERVGSDTDSEEWDLLDEFGEEGE